MNVIMFSYVLTIRHYNQPTFFLKVWVIRVNLRKGKVKLVLVYIEFELSKFELADGKWLENWNQT